MEQYRKTPRTKYLGYLTGNYFITICTASRRPYFGMIADGEMVLSNIGLFVDSQLRHASDFTDFEVPLWVVMPEHIHAIVCIPDNPVSEPASPLEQRSVASPLRACSGEQRQVPNLSRYINSLKGAVTKFARRNDIDFAWQSRYYDHLIRDSHDGNNIAEYILSNVAKRWEAMRAK